MAGLYGYPHVRPKLIMDRRHLKQRFGEKYVTNDQMRGILLFDSENTLQAVYHSRTNTLAGRKQGRRFGALLDFGSGFESIIAIPITYTGAQALRKLLVTDTVDDRDKIIDSLIDPQMYYHSQKASPSLFPLEDPFESLYAVEPWLDIIRLRQLKAKMKNARYDLRLLCPQRDEEFYQMLLPEMMVWDKEKGVDFNSRCPLI